MIALVALMLLAIAWIAAAMGLVTGSAEGAASLAAIIQILPFLSSAFVPTDTWLQVFTAHQPMTPIVSTLRGLLTDTPVGSHGWIAVVWCVGIAVAGYVSARMAYNRPTTR